MSVRLQGAGGAAAKKVDWRRTIFWITLEVLMAYSFSWCAGMVYPDKKKNGTISVARVSALPRGRVRRCGAGPGTSTSARQRLMIDADAS